MSVVQSYFMKLVDDTVEASVRHVRAFVHQYLSARLAEARAQIEQYGSRYAEAMLHALDTSKQGMLLPGDPLARIDDTLGRWRTTKCPVNIGE